MTNVKETCYWLLRWHTEEQFTDWVFYANKKKKKHKHTKHDNNFSVT